MKKKETRLFAMLLAAMLLLSACGTGNPPASDANSGTTTTPDTATEPETPEKEPVKDWYTYQVSASDLTTFLIYGTESGPELEVLQCLTTPLLEETTTGQMLPAAAKEWGTEDGGLTWTFQLRDDIVWVDVDGNEKAKTTAQDWITGLEWILNFHKNDSSNTSMPKMMLEGAQEYCDYTQNLSEEEALALTVENGPFLEMVGIEAPDDYTLVYHCLKNVPYFDTLGSAPVMRPMSQAMVDELGVRGVQNMDNSTMWYNGAYIMSDFIQANSRTLVRNKSYWDKDCTLFDSVHYAVVSDALSAQQLFMNGELDWCTLSESNLKTIYENPNSEWYPYLVESRPTAYSFQIHWNFFKNLDDGETPDEDWNNAISNLAFRKSMAYGLDMSKYWARYNFINPESCENVAYTMKEMMYYPDGRDYVSQVWEELGYNSGRYDAEKAQQYKEQAMQELAGKVEFPVEVDYFIAASNQDSLDQATILKEIFEAMGTDYVVFNIKTYVASSTQEVTIPRRHSFSIIGWGADYRDPENFLGQEIRGDESAAMKRTNGCNFITDEGMIETFDTFTQMYREAAAICDDMTERYDAFAKAEAYLIDNVITLPVSYRVNWMLTKGNDYVNARGFKNWETSTEPYKTGDYEQFKADFYGN